VRPLALIFYPSALFFHHSTSLLSPCSPQEVVLTEKCVPSAKAYETKDLKEASIGNAK
jgi:hypothetical protein